MWCFLLVITNLPFNSLRPTQKYFSSHCTVFYIPLLVFLLRPSAYIITPRFVYLLPLAWDLWISKFAAVKLRLWGLWYCCWVIAQALQLGNCGTKMWSIMINCKHSIKWKPSAISISDYFHVRCPAKGMPLINPCVRFFGIGVKSHDVTTVDEPFRYSIPPLSRSASFHSFYSCPARTMKLRLWNLTKRGHSVITEFQSCSLTIFGWLLSFAGPNLIFLNIRNQPFCRGKEKGCVVEHIYAKVVPKLRPME